MATIDFLVGVHGNGLTHSLWMTPGKGRTVFEIQAKACSMNDYSPLAAAAGLDHFLVRHDEMCNVHDCPPRGCHYPAEDEEAEKAGLNSNNLKVDPKLITDQIRAMIHKYHMGDD